MNSLAHNPALKSHVDTQLSFFNELAQRSLDSARKLGELNLQLGRQLLETTLDAGRQLAACTDPFQAGAIPMRLAEPVARHLRGYQQALVGVVAGAQAELTHAAETHIPEAGRSAQALADDFARRSAEAGKAFASYQRAAADVAGAARGPNGQQEPG
ncbi:phasin family protein [Massilia cavernae]|uniref:Phasin family protein n=1 Tax=Massilia cavernae TaxID=2320864 RepID=A0A418X701_9BURK|nr:phasin family protein [Massilia cavernae]RJG08231.1 phasin family protein [Massilia cavernae]